MALYDVQIELIGFTGIPVNSNHTRDKSVKGPGKKGVRLSADLDKLSNYLTSLVARVCIPRSRASHIFRRDEYTFPRLPMRP